MAHGLHYFGSWVSTGQLGIYLGQDEILVWPPWGDSQISLFQSTYNVPKEVRPSKAKGSRCRSAWAEPCHGEDLGRSLQPFFGAAQDDLANVERESQDGNFVGRAQRRNCSTWT